MASKDSLMEYWREVRAGTIGLAQLDAGRAALKRARQLVESTGITSPPVVPHLKDIAGTVGVKEIRRTKIAGDGTLVPCEDGYLILVNETHALERQAFTVAHEIAHIILWGEERSGDELRNVTFRLRRHRGIEERICNRIAGELLMPKRLFEPAVSELGLAAASIPDLARMFQTSYSATAIRLAHCDLGICIVIIWQLARNADFEVTPLVKWAAKPDIVNLYIPQGAPQRVPDSVLECWETSVPVGNFEELRLGGIRGRYYMDSARIGAQIFSVVHLKPHSPSGRTLAG